MIDHVKVGVRDVQKAKEYYTKALAPLGYSIHFEGEEMAYFADTASLDFGVGATDSPGTTHVGFTVADADTVRAFYEAALAAGGVGNGAPGLRPEYGAGYYAAYVLDPDRSNAIVNASEIGVAVAESVETVLCVVGEPVAGRTALMG